MANKIKSISVKIGGDTIDLNRALKDVNKNSAYLNSELNQINRQLKFDPSSAVLLSQKQDVLRDSISAAKDKLKELETVQDDIERQYKNGEIDNGKYRAYQREVEQTKSKLNSYEGQLKATQTTQENFNKKIAESREKLDSVKHSLNSGIKTAGKWAAATGAAAVTGIIKVAEEASEKLDTVDKMSQKIGVSRQTYQELDFVFSQLGTNVDGLKNGLKTLRSVMDTTAQGTSKNKTALEELGISAIDVSGNLRDSEDVMWEAFKTLQGMENQTKKARLATKLFGKAGLELMPMLNGSAGSVENLRKKAHKLGLVLDNETIDKGVEFKDTLDQTKRALSAVGTELGAAFMPALVRVMRKVQDKMPEIRKMVEGFGKKVENDIEWFIDNGDTVIKLVKAAGIEIAGIYTAIKANRAVKSISETISAFRALTSATAAQKAATVAATAATEAETVAQTGLNVAMSANGIAAVVSGLIFLGSTLWAVIKTTDNYAKSTEGLTDSERKLIDKTHEEHERLKELQETRKKSISTIDNEYDHYDKLWNELKAIVDENGKVKRGYKSRAKFITGELSDAFQVEFDWNKDIIQNYKDIQSELEGVMRKKKLAAQQDSFEEEYNDAISNQSEYRDRYLKDRNTYRALRKEFQSYNDEIKQLRKESSDIAAKYHGGRVTGHDMDIIKSNTTAINTATSNKNAIKDDLINARKAFKEAEQDYVNSLSTIKNYESLSEAILSDNEKAIELYLVQIENGFISSKNGTERTLKQQVSTVSANYREMEKALREGTPGVTQEMVDALGKLLKKCEDALKHYYDAGRNLSEELLAGFVDGLDFSSSLNTKGARIEKFAKRGATNNDYGSKLGKKLGDDFAKGYANGLGYNNATKEKIKLHAANLPNYTKTVVEKTQDSHSPSRVAMKYGGYWPEGYVIGFAEKAKAVREKLRAAAESMQPPAEAAAVTPSFSGNLKTLSSGGKFAQSLYKTYNNTPVINVNFGDVSVRDDSDIDVLADKVSVKIVDQIILKGVANGD